LKAPGFSLKAPGFNPCGFQVKNTCFELCFHILLVPLYITGAKEGNTEFLALFNRTDLEMPWPDPPPVKEAAP
jgi:hypothetical protein